MEHEGIAADGVDGSPKAMIEAAISSKPARRSRSGSHLRQRGEVWYYRRAVPKDARKAFGCWEIIKSLDTTSETEAKRLEKQHDVDFERRLQRARDEANPETRQARIASDIIATHPLNYPMAQWGMAYLPAKDREAVREMITPHYEALDAHRHEIARLVEEITKALPPTPLPPEIWQRCRHGIISVVRQHVATVTGETAPPVIDGIYTLEWAYSRWLRTRTGVRTEESVDTARRHFDAFVADSKLVMLDQVRRSHVEAWRDRLVDCREYRPNTINQRLQLVGAILRAGWRSAEMPEQNLKGLVLPNPDDNDRAAWKPDEILKALRALESNTWASWVYLIGLTTGVRIGEPLAARVDWFDPKTSMIEVNDRRFTKAKKLHCMPLIHCLREPFHAYAEGRAGDQYLFDDAPRPSNPKLRAAHEASKWFSRFFAKHTIDRVFHELRDTWIEAAKHSPVERDIWEIISGHSAATVSDRYGGKKSDVLTAANEKICEFLMADAEIKSAMLRLVS
jgi:integrase